MTNQDNGIILYTDLDQLPKIGANGEIISPGTSALMGAASSGIGELIKKGVFGNNNILKLALSSGDVLNKVLEISFEFVYNEEGTISGINVLNGSDVAGAISVDIFNALIDTPAQYTLSSVLLAAAAPIIGSSVIGVVIGATVIGAGVSYAYPYIRGFTNDAFNSLFFNTGKVDLQFTDASGEHDSGLFFKDGMGGLSDKGAIAYFLANSGENTHGGTFNFSTSGLDRSYDVYDASIYQTVAEKLGIELEDFLAAGYNGKTNADGFIGGAAYSAIFNTKSPSLIYIPIKVNGVTEVFLVNGIYVGDIKSDALSMGRNTEAVLGNALILNGKDGSLVIRQHSSDPLVEDNYVIVGDAGSNNINTEDGNDTIVAGGGSDKISAGYGRNVIDGGEGVDTVDYSFLSFGSRDIDVNLENHTATNGYASLNRVNDTLYKVENIIGSQGNDNISGNSSNNTFYGNDGNDVLVGNGQCNFL